MSHPIPGHDYSEQHNRESDAEYNSRKGAAHKALRKKSGKTYKSTASKLIDDLKNRPGESALSKLKRLTGK